MKKISKKLLNHIVSSLVNELKPDKIILFGSHVWGMPTEDSDLDLLVIVSSSDLTPTKRAAKAYRCLRDVNFPKDILVKTKAEIKKDSQIHASLVSEVLERGKILYE